MFDNRKAMELQKLNGVENFRKLTIPQMLERGKLIELLESAESAVYWNSSDKGFIEKIADHLIANDVVPVVRCKNCKYLIETSASSTKIACTKGVNWRAVEQNHFCSYGERKDNDST